jgi:hypothetical protein
MFHQRLDVKTRLQKVGVTNIACMIFGRDNMVEHVSWRC